MIENNGKQNRLKIKYLIVTFDLCHKQSFFFKLYIWHNKTYDLLFYPMQENKYPCLDFKKINNLMLRY